MRACLTAIVNEELTSPAHRNVGEGSSMNEQPKAVAVTFEEGGPWIPFVPYWHPLYDSRDGRVVHAIKFADGSIWDAVNGWHTPTAE
jgi:hypothetical protein